MKTRRIFWAVTAFLAAMTVLAGCVDVDDPTEGDLNSTLNGNITISPSSNVTLGTQLTANYSGTESVTLSYQWKKGGTNVGSNLNQFTPTEAGSYTVTVSAAGYKSKTSAPVTVSSTGGITLGPNAAEYPNPVPQPAIVDSDPLTRTLKRTAPNTDGTERQRVYHEVWIGIDTNADPRNVVGYKLSNSGKQFFDNVVIFHAGLSWDHFDDTNPPNYEPSTDARKHWCPKTGIHLHLHDKTQWVLADWNKFIKPLKDAGLQVLICPLPSQGVSYHTIGDWPEGNSVWNNSTSGTRWGNYESISGVAGAKRWAKELADFCEEYQFDGIALDDEYGELPAGFDKRSSIYSLPATASGQNIFRWLRYFKDITTDEAHPNGKWVSVYYHRNGTNIPGSLSLASVDKNGNDIAAKTYSVNDVVDALFPAQYGTATTNMNPSALDNSRRGYTSFAFDGAGSSISVGMDSIGQRTRTAMNGGYGVMMYFALQHRGHYQTLKFFDEAFGTQPDVWLSRISNVLYQDGVWYDGPDHPKFPSQRGIGVWTSNTGALYKPNPGPGERPRDYANDYF